MSLRRTAFKSALWSALENGSTTVISFLSLIVFAKLLDPQDFGAFAIALAVIEVAGILTNMFFYESLIQIGEAKDEHFDGAFTASIIISIVVFAVLWVAFPFLADLVGDRRISDIGRTLGAGLLITGPVSILIAKQSREFGFRVLALRTLFGRIAGAAIGIAAAFFDYGVWSLVIQNMAMMLLGSAALVFFSSWRPRLTANLRPLDDLFRYSLGSVVAISASFLTKRAFIFSVGAFLGVEKAGFLNLAFRLVDTLWAISATAISQVLLPLLSRLQGNGKRLLEAYQIILLAGCMLLYPAFVGLGAIAPEIIQLMFGEKWLPAAPATFWLGFLVFAQAHRLFQTSLLKVTGNIQIVRSMNLVELALMALGIALTKLPTEFAALSLWFVVEFTNAAMLTFLIKQKMNISYRYQLSPVVFPLLSSCIMAYVVGITRDYFLADYSASLRIVILCATGIFSYLLILICFDRRSVSTLLREVRVLRNT